MGYEKNNYLNCIDTYAPGCPGSELDSRFKTVSDIILNKNKSDAFSNSLLDSILINNKVKLYAKIFRINYKIL